MKNISFKTKILLFSGILLFFIFDTVRAEDIFLKSGEVISGVVTKKTKDLISVDIGVGVDVTYFLDDVASIKKEPKKNEITHEALPLPGLNEFSSPQGSKKNESSLDENGEKIDLKEFKKKMADYINQTNVSEKKDHVAKSPHVSFLDNKFFMKKENLETIKSFCQEFNIVGFVSSFVGLIVFLVFFCIGNCIPNKSIAGLFHFMGFGVTFFWISMALEFFQADYKDAATSGIYFIILLIIIAIIKSLFFKKKKIETSVETDFYNQAPY